MTIKGFHRFGLRGRLLAGALVLIMLPVLSVGYWINYSLARYRKNWRSGRDSQ
ncbi:hypothetical protein [Paradesulfitobacterium aromaticivorans]